MKRALLLITLIVLYVLHQDFWFWRTARPLFLGFLPVGLFYHACYTLAVAVAMWLLVKHAWSSQLEESSVDFSLRNSGSVDSDLRNNEHRLKSMPRPQEGAER